MKATDGWAIDSDHNVLEFISCEPADLERHRDAGQPR